MIFGLTYNIHEIGSYIREHVESALPTPTGFLWWQHSLQNAHNRSWDVGRTMSRTGNYVITSLACGVSFALTRNKLPGHQ
jgi:hypothetical protein